MKENTINYRRTTPFSVPIVFVVTASRQPIRIREECNETLPEHADMLKYDLGFHSLRNLSLVIFPWFRHYTDGSYPVKITEGRWGWFSMRLERFAVGGEASGLIQKHPIGGWIGYQHVDGDRTRLESITLDRWLKAHPKVTILGWRIAACDEVLIEN
jgi:hypothetical protein